MSSAEDRVQAEKTKKRSSQDATEISTNDFVDSVIKPPISGPDNDQEQGPISISSKHRRSNGNVSQVEETEGAESTSPPEESRAKSADQKTGHSKDKTHEVEREKAVKFLDKTIKEESEESDYYPSADESDVGTGYHTLNREAQRNPYRSLRKPLDQRLPKAERRMYQHMLYTTLIEDRLLFLEKSVKDLKKQKDGPVEKEEKKKHAHILKIDFQEWTDFEIKPITREGSKNWKHGGIVDTSPHPVLEVLTGEPQVNTRRRPQESNQGKERSKESNASQINSERPQSDQTAALTQQVPMRVRIRSPHLLRLLNRLSPERSPGTSDIVGSAESRNKAVRPPAFKSALLGGPDRALTTMLRPFKLLVTKAPQIKEHLNRLEDIHKDSGEGDKPPGTPPGKKSLEMKTKNEEQKSPRTDSSAPAVDEEAEEQDGSKDLESYEALEHLRILNKFINEDLKFVWDLRRQYQEGTLRRISFADLWHLFDYGQEVRTPENQNMQL